MNFLFQASGQFELRLQSFANVHALNSEGNCCSGIRPMGQCSEPCRTFFRVCLSHYQTSINPEVTCTFGQVITPVLSVENTFTFPDSATRFNNPIAFEFPFTWPVSRVEYFVSIVYYVDEHYEWNEVYVQNKIWMEISGETKNTYVLNNNRQGFVLTFVWLELMTSVAIFK